MKSLKIAASLLAALLLVPAPALAGAKIRLGNEVLYSRYHHLVCGRRVGLVTNQSGVDSQGRSLIDILAADPAVDLVALYGPEHGIDGQAKAGVYVESYVHPVLEIPVYSLYGATRMPTAKMLEDVDVLLFDLQDIGARTYTYMSTLNYVMVAARQHNKPVVVLDRPNPLGGLIVEGPVLEDRFISFVGVDNLPMAHGMTAGELARFFNRKIGANLTVVPMEGYTRGMVWQDTGLAWVQTSPNVPDVEAVFGYMATGLGEGTGIYMADKFRWIGGKNIDAQSFARLLNHAGLPGVTFVPELQKGVGGVRLKITDYRAFNPARAGIFALAFARQLASFPVPKSGQAIAMFDKVMGTDKMGQWLAKKLSPWQIEANLQPALERFRVEREKYLIYGDKPYRIAVSVLVFGLPVAFDAGPYIDGNGRVMVPLRAVAEALGARVHWDGAGTVALERQGRRVVFSVGSAEVAVEGERRTMDTVPALRDGRVLVPVRFAGQYLGMRVSWDPFTRTAFLD